MSDTKRLGLTCLFLFTAACGDDGVTTEPSTSSVGPLTFPQTSGVTTTNPTAETTDTAPTSADTSNASNVMTGNDTTAGTTSTTVTSTGPDTVTASSGTTDPATDSGVSATQGTTMGTTGGTSTGGSSSSEGPNQICMPGEKQCLDGVNYETCSGDGLTWDGPTACPGKLVCEGAGDCISKCDKAEANLSSIGCRYYAIDANNDPAENYDTQPYAVAVSNVDPVQIAEVQVQVFQNGAWATIQMDTVDPKQLKQFNLPDRHVNYTANNPRGAYRIISDVPIIAYQFQPINGQTSFTSDASLLLPSAAYDSFYYVLGWGEPSFGNAQINIVAAQDNTNVTMTPTTATVAGGGIPALQANQPYVFPAMNEGDVIQIEANNLFAGTYLTADKPFAVFSTHWCANVPNQNCCCDHLEEQIYGLQKWGTTYVASRWPVRSAGQPETSVWQVIAAEDATNVKFIKHAEVTGIPQDQIVMNKGQVVTLQVAGSIANPGDFLIDADKPIFVMQYLTNSANSGQPDASKAGDPAMAQAIPAEQYRSDYVVLVPVAWNYDFFTVTKKTGSTVNLDGAPIPQASFVKVGPANMPTEWEVARIPVPDGVHALDGDAPFGVIVLGYDTYDSYAYPGGLDQKQINPQ